MQATSIAIAHLARQTESSLAAIEERFPSFYAALMPFRFSAQLMAVRSAAKQCNDMKMEPKEYAQLTRDFLCDQRNQPFINADLRSRVERSAAERVGRSILLAGSPKEVLQIQLPSLERKYKSYLQLLTDALVEDVTENYPLARSAADGTPNDKEKPHGDSAKMILANMDQSWLERLYEYRWAYVARKVAQQLEQHKTEFRGSPLRGIGQFQQAVEQHSARSGQMGLPGF